jgi:hypothetical protein
MSQHSINLITPEIIQRTRAGIRTGRFILAGFMLTVCMVLTATHSRLRLDGIVEEHSVTSAQAELALDLDQAADVLQAEHDRIQTFMEDYHSVALPLDITRVIATLVESLPESVTIVNFDLEYADAEDSQNASTRHLFGSIGGVAASDSDVAALAHGLGLRPPFDLVQLEYSRSREIRGRSAREFSVSFKVDLQGQFKLVDAASEHLGDRP